MINHTPGPWEAVGHDIYSGGFGPHSCTLKIASAETEEDASLVATAPELLAALEALTNRYRGTKIALSTENAALVEQAFKAITKAKGEA